MQCVELFECVDNTDAQRLQACVRRREEQRKVRERRYQQRRDDMRRIGELRIQEPKLDPCKACDT